MTKKLCRNNVVSRVLWKQCIHDRRNIYLSFKIFPVFFLPLSPDLSIDYPVVLFGIFPVVHNSDEWL